MEKIVVKTQSMYNKKAREIARLFLAANPRAIGDLDLPSVIFGISKCPTEYPNGVCLVLKKKCPYCESVKEYDYVSWGARNPNPSVHLSPDFPYLNAIREIKGLNPGICDECARSTYQSSGQSSENKQTDSKSGGFWDGFLEGLRGDK